ncbi:MAG: Carboxyvinyl-carboxyphosphonate phosphorylmutase [uncultured Acidimicrobiales bacterium]|uniref:Carboxyvinyl-carboxyphosphonate phosphorylmutase n=1 Tax=uncultured Acidimicrobiales bacterium TaxID=310071 RepID=A0A6J4ICW4_9ACTN|nr:MAG: Carboxyvinyl-carboxyphosphonate phosphorylmutase [uncultured Acidimicrobiales bacterium]
MNGDHLRSLLASDQTVLMPGVWDALSARLASDAGFEVLFLSGFATAASLLGLPDFGYLTQAEMAEVARRVCRTVGGCAVVVDGDTGGGNALNTIRTVELFEAAGAAGIFLEDQVWPKKCGHMAGKRVVPREDWLGKLQAALDHRWKLFVVARTDARSSLGLDEAILRARMAAALGVDAVFVEAPESIEEMQAVADALPGVVLVANMIEAGKTPLLAPAELHDLGYDLIVSPLSGLFAMARSVGTAYHVLADQGTLRNHLDLVSTFDDFNRVVDLEGHYRLEARYQPPE